MGSSYQQHSGEDKQNKVLKIISFKDRTETSDPLYTNHKILKLQNIITLITYQMLSQIISNFLKINTGIKQGIPITFTLNVPRVKTGTYGLNSVKIEAIKDSSKTAKKIQFHTDLLFK